MISKHITMAEATNSETAKKLGISNLPNDVELANMKLVAEKCFEPIREWYGKPLRINSFFRSAKLNSSIGGSSGTSQHCLGQAIDLSSGNNAENKKIFLWAKDNLVYDQIIYEYGDDNGCDWVHISYKPTGNRKQALRCSKVNGKPSYTNYK
jgi:zinc D-Ala-D-Ala carboxypeptidase